MISEELRSMSDAEIRSEVPDELIRAAKAEIRNLVRERGGRAHRDTILRHVSEQLDLSMRDATMTVAAVRPELTGGTGGLFNQRGWTSIKELATGGGDITAIKRQPGRETDDDYHGLAKLQDVGHPEVPAIEDYYEQELPDADVTDVQVLCRTLADNDFSPLLVGEAGTGKDTLVMHVCAETNRPVVRVNFGSDVRYENIVGMYTLNADEEMEWVDGVLTHAVRYGWVFIADEINAAPPESTMPLHQVTEEGDRSGLLLREESEVVTPHPQFRFVATMNPPRGGYGGANQLNDAFKSRFYTIQVDYLDPDRESELVEAKTDNESLDSEQIERLCRMASRLRRQYKREEISTPITTRELLKATNLAEIMSLREAATVVLTGHAKEEDEQTIRDVIDGHLE